MNEYVAINPGSGPTRGLAREARRNIGAFCRDLAMPAPRVSIAGGERSEDGRYTFTISRGIRSTVVDMVGLPLDQVRYVEGCNPWNFPRLYVDGSSWLWEFAINMARSDLLDHDGSAEAGYKRSEVDVSQVFELEPRCATCGSIKDRYYDFKVNLPYGYEKIRCVVCAPVEKTFIRNWEGAVYVDDSWKKVRYGAVYRCTERLMPYEAMGTDESPRCMRGYYHNRTCRLVAGHDGNCAPVWQETARERIELPWKEPSA